MKAIKNIFARLLLVGMAICASHSYANDAPSNDALSRDSMPLGQFVNEALISGVAQLESAKLALRQSATPAIKEFAQLIIDERITANNDLTTIVKKKPIKIMSDSELLSKAQALIAKPTNNESFDAAYVQNQIKARQDEIELFNKGALSKDPELAGFATENIPKLTHNLHLAETLAKDINKK